MLDHGLSLQRRVACLSVHRRCFECSARPQPCHGLFLALLDSARILPAAVRPVGKEIRRHAPLTSFSVRPCCFWWYGPSKNCVDLKRSCRPSPAASLTLSASFASASASSCLKLLAILR